MSAQDGPGSRFSGFTLGARRPVVGLLVGLLRAPTRREADSGGISGVRNGVNPCILSTVFQHVSGCYRQDGARAN